MRLSFSVVYVIPPGQLKNLRSRYGSAGNKDDRFDAYVLADVVRTDRRRRPRPPSSRGESHPPALTDPYVTISRHTALVVLVTRPEGRR